VKSPKKKREEEKRPATSSTAVCDNHDGARLLRLANENIPNCSAPAGSASNEVVAAPLSSLPVDISQMDSPACLLRAW